MARVFGGFNPLDLLEMEVDDLLWWLGQAEKMAEEMNSDGG